jgi:hypothetical protein
MPNFRCYCKFNDVIAQFELLTNFLIFYFNIGLFDKDRKKCLTTPSLLMLRNIQIALFRIFPKIVFNLTIKNLNQLFYSHFIHSLWQPSASQTKPYSSLKNNEVIQKRASSNGLEFNGNWNFSSSFFRFHCLFFCSLMMKIKSIKFCRLFHPKLKIFFWKKIN